MVYIGLDDQSRTKGKAAIDVAGAQTGKSAGSVLQQVLLVASSGSAAAALPAMAAAYWGILVAWKKAVDTLDALHVVAFDEDGGTDVGDGLTVDDESSSDDEEVVPPAAAPAPAA